MKKIILLLLLSIIHLLTYSQRTSVVNNVRKNITRPVFLQCLPEIIRVEYSENTREPILPFNFKKLYFETRLDFYLIVTIEIDALGMTTVNIQDDYYAQTTTIKSKMTGSELHNLTHILAHCDYDSFRENAIADDLNCCNSFFEISFNDHVKRANESAFFPFNNRELELVLWKKMKISLHSNSITPSREYY
jgi:hypothetical protein